MRNLIIAGLGPGKIELVTVEALNEAENADVILVPRSRKNEKGMAENILSNHLPDKIKIPVLFPMLRDEKQRDEIITSQLEALKSKLEQAGRIFFPVIGDSMLYSTGAYLLASIRKIFPDTEAVFIPGISAHSAAASCAKKFLAMSDEILSIIPGTAAPEKISSILKYCDSAAIYKPTALKNLRKIIESSGFRNVIRVDFAGIPEREKVYEGLSSLDEVDEYMSVILLWR